MQVVILAGGLGTRLKALAFDGPKALVPVNGVPFVDHQLKLLADQQCSDVLICVGHLGDRIQSHVGDGAGHGVHVRYVCEKPDALLGTGGALLNALPHLESEFVVMYGDSYLPMDLKQMMRWCKASAFPAVMSVFRNRGQWDKSNVRISGEKVSFYSKTAEVGECDHIDYGLSYFRRELLAEYAHGPLPLDLGFIQRELASSGRLGAYLVQQRFYEVGTPEGISALEAYFREQKA